MKTYQAAIYITLRPSVLDPAGAAVQTGARQLGYGGVEQLRIGKYVELTLRARDEVAAMAEVNDLCDRLLANPVTENYRITLTEVPAPASVPGYSGQISCQDSGLGKNVPIA